MIEIKNRFTHEVLFTSKTAATVRAAVSEAARKGVSIYCADLRNADLQGVHFRHAELWNVDFRGADLRRAYFDRADLRGANLRGADLSGAGLVGARLAPTDGLTFYAGPSGPGHLIPLDANGKHDRDGEWHVTIGCWQDKTLDDLRALINDEAEWPEATGYERDRRRPYLRAVLAMCEAHIAYQAGEVS